MKRGLLILCLFIFSFQLHAQFKLNFNENKKTDSPKEVVRKKNLYLKQANKQFALLKYAYAIPLYKNYLKLGGKDKYAYKQLGYSYNMVNQIDSALFYYKIAKIQGLKMGSIIAELEAQVGHYDSAKYNYKQLINENKTQLYESRLNGFSNLNKFYDDSLDYKIFNTKFNTIYNDLNIVPYKGGYIFESNRYISNKKKKYKKVFSTEFSWDGNPYSSLYYTSNTNNIRVDSIPYFQWKEKKLGNNFLSLETSNDSKKVFKSVDFTPKIVYNDTSIKLFSKWIKTKLNVGSITFTKDAKTAYFTRNGRRHKQNYLLEIWEAKFINEKWRTTKKMFFNRKDYNYFHPAITPDGKRLYYVSDEANGFGGTDIYYTEKNEDGSWKPTINAGREINTEANELFPTFYENELYFSSNGRAGLGGLDIYKLIKDDRGDLIPKNLGYPINSNKDDFSFILKDSSGFFCSNRNGSDDIFAFDLKPVYIILKGQIQFENKNSSTKKIYLTQTNEIGLTTIIDSAYLDSTGSYNLKARPNKNYKIVVFNGVGNKIEKPIISNGFVYNNDLNFKQLDLMVYPLTEAEIAAKKEALLNDSINKIHLVKNDKLFAKTIDSLMKLTDDYVEMHHYFNKVSIVKNDTSNYHKLLNRIKLMRGREIVIVSATDCKGTESYNEGLSQRRAKNIYNAIIRISNNNVVIKHVGERELLKACDDVKKSIEEQLINRYSYVFIMKSK